MKIKQVPCSGIKYPLLRHFQTRAKLPPVVVFDTPSDHFLHPAHSGNGFPGFWKEATSKSVWRIRAEPSLYLLDDRRQYLWYVPTDFVNRHRSLLYDSMK